MISKSKFFPTILHYYFINYFLQPITLISYFLIYILLHLANFLMDFLILIIFNFIKLNLAHFIIIKMQELRKHKLYHTYSCKKWL
jgi:hypothetical protein